MVIDIDNLLNYTLPTDICVLIVYPLTFIASRPPTCGARVNDYLSTTKRANTRAYIVLLTAWAFMFL
ncbi:MAG: hypothetical protein JXA33_10150 [Anaerolineae bacterium]|nr:hypothetical protein [Anaerolineae bacterium]